MGNINNKSPRVEDSNNVDIENVVLTNTSNENGGINGPRNLEFEQDDYVKSIKVRIGDLVSKKSRQEHNSQVMSSDSIEVSIRMPDGKPAPLSPSTSAEETYVEQVFEGSSDGEKALGAFQTNSNLLDYKIAKGKSPDPNLPTIDSVISDVNMNGTGASLNQDVTIKLGSYNKLYSERTFIVEGVNEEKDNPNLNSYTIQNQSGKHLPSKWPEANEEPQNNLSLQDLMNLGLQIMLEGSGEIKVPKQKDKEINVEAAQALASTVPGLARLGLRVPTANFLPGNIMEQVNPDYKKPGKNPLEKEDQRLSHGNTNNPLIPFNSLNTTSNRIASGILILAVSQMLRGLARVINTDKVFSTLNQIKDFRVPLQNNTTPLSTYDIIQKRLGSSKGTAYTSNGVAFFRNPDDILFSRNYNQFGNAVDRGVALFFELGTDNPIGLLNPLIRSFVSNTNPGYYNVILRMLINDVNNIFSSIIPANLVVTRDPTEIDKAREIRNNPASATLGTLDNTINLIGTLRDSKLLRFMDILSRIGDLSLMSQGDRRFTSIIDSTSDITTTNNPDLTTTNINLSSLVKKNRLSDQVRSGRGNLAWGSNKIPSLYLLPDSILDAEYQFSNERTFHKTLSKDKGFVQNSNGRFPVETIIEMEKMLDAYYVPFYFQDLRTNEIISFQCFIESLSDSFDAEYAESDGIGRIDPVYKYKNTRRTLGVSFYVVATNKQDFDEMWLKINKFVMMLYPQYTLGREVISDGNKFIQPLSQLIGASPLIRLRIGDLIKSNYSDLDAARLFGVGQGHFEINGQTLQPVGQRERTEAARALEVRTNMTNGIFSIGQRFRLTQPYSAIVAGNQPPLNPVATAANAIQLLPGPITNRLSDGQATSNPSNITSQIGTVVNNRLWIELPTNSVMNVVSIDVSNRIYTISAEQPVQGVSSGQTFAIQFNNNVSDIAVNEDDINHNIQISIPNASDEENVQTQPSSFFSIEQNPIFQSFDTVRGQGLAGFIRGMKFDYNDMLWETEGLNNRAPKYVKIDFDFAPIHDISPGLDSNGFMIGAPYNIGEIMKALKKNRQQRIESLTDTQTPSTPNGNS
jgi:hypothetical protein